MGGELFEHLRGFIDSVNMAARSAVVFAYIEESIIYIGKALSSNLTCDVIVAWSEL